MKYLTLLVVVLLLSCSPQTGRERSLESEGAMTDSLRYHTTEGAVRVALVKQPFHGGRNVPELSRNPDYLEEGGLTGLLENTVWGSVPDTFPQGLTEAFFADRQGPGVLLKPVQTVVLTPEEDREYGEWHRLGLANGHLADFVAANEREGFVTVGLLANCNALLGMLGGFQTSGTSGEPRRVGLLWVDAHGDFNTPETTLSGMLGGMPVAVSAGLALHRLRRESKLDPPISTEDIVMVAVRDTDPEERILMEEHRLATLSTEDVREVSEALHAQMRRLSDETDLIYVHVDMDVLDPAEVQGHGLTVEGGPTSQELAAALEEVFQYPKVAGLGIASTPAYEADPGEISRRAAYRLIQGALQGVAARNREPE
jgi:arginase